MGNLNLPGITKLPPHLQKPALALAGVGVLTVLGTLGIAFRKESPEDITRRITSQADATSAEQVRKMKELAAETQLKNAQREEERQIKALAEEKRKDQETADRAKKRSEDDRNRELVKAEREKQDLADNQKREADRQAAADLRLKNEMAKAQKKTEEANAKTESEADQQVQRTKLAEQLFTSINIEPRVTISPKLKGFGTSVETKGEKLAPIQKFYQDHDWLGLYNFANKSKETKFPMDSLIRYGVSDLEDIHIPLLLKTTFQKSGDEELIALFISKFTRGNLHFEINYANRGGAKLHPDGVGYIFDWKIGMHDVLFLTGGSKQHSQYKKFEDEYKEEIKAYGAKLKLTEISQETHDTSVVKAEREVIERIAAWVAAGAQ